MVRTDHNAGGGAAAAAAVVPQQPPAWFKEFYRERIGRLTVIARAAGARTSEAAEDAVQETMMQVLRRGDELAHPWAYAKKAVVTEVIRANERNARRVARETRNFLITTVSGQEEGHADPQLTLWEDRQWVEGLLPGLTAVQREVMEAVLDGLSTRGVSELLGKSEATVRKHMQYARERLKDELRRTPDHAEE